MVAENITGLSPEFIIHPGETIADLISDRNLTQKEVAIKAGVTEAFLSKVINGEKSISTKLAKGLEYAFGVESSFWINLQSLYDKELQDYKEEKEIKDEEIAVSVF